MPNLSRAARRNTPRALVVLTAAAVAFGLAGCDRNDGTTVGQKVDSAVARTEQAAADAKAKVQDGMPRAEESARSTGNAIAEKVDDLTITAQVSAGLAKDPDLSALKINVDTTSGAVTLNGPATTEQARERATVIAKSIKGVTSVNNQLTVKVS